MKVKMLNLAAGPTITLEAGKVYDLPNAQAKMLIEGGYAVEYKAPLKTVERAVAAGNRQEQATAAGSESKPRRGRGLDALFQGAQAPEAGESDPAEGADEADAETGEAGAGENKES